MASREKLLFYTDTQTRVSSTKLRLIKTKGTELNSTKLAREALFLQTKVTKDMRDFKQNNFQVKRKRPLSAYTYKPLPKIEKMSPIKACKPIFMQKPGTKLNVLFNDSGKIKQVYFS